MNEKKVYISGVGILTGNSNISQKHCYIDDNDIMSYLSGYQLRSMDRISKLTLAAAAAAINNAKLDLKSDRNNDCSMILGSMYGALDSVHTFDMVSVEKGALAVNPSLFPNTVQNSPACQSGIPLKITGAILTVCNGMKSGLDAIGLGYYHLKWGVSSVVLAGAADEISELQLHMHKVAKPIHETSSFVVLESRNEGKSSNPIIEVVGYNTQAFINLGEDEIIESSGNFLKMFLLSANLTDKEIGCLSICTDFDRDSQIINNICDSIRYIGLKQCMMEDRMSASGPYQVASICSNQGSYNKNCPYNIVVNICRTGISAVLLKVVDSLK